MNETTLIEKLIKIEALFAGAATDGERASADQARQRILKRLQELLLQDPPVEYKFTFSDMWSRKVFVTLLRRYGLTPYRYYRQRYTTVMAKVPKRFLDETLWPEFQKINEELNSYLQKVTDRVVKKVLHEDISDAVVVEQPLKISLDQNSISKNPITAQNEKLGMSYGTHKTGSRKKKKRKKKKRNR